MIIWIECVGNLGLVHTLFREFMLLGCVNTNTKNQQLVAHLNEPAPQELIVDLIELVQDRSIAAVTFSRKAN